jgi:pyruvate dehydrogenase E1 component
MIFEDKDPSGTQEWIDAFAALVEAEGLDKAIYLIQSLIDESRDFGAVQPYSATTPYYNTISLDSQVQFPESLEVERRLRSIIRWNAMAMVVRANRKAGELGGHLTSYASSATLYEIGFNHFYKGDGGNYQGDFIFFQGHCAPGIYARAFLEGRLSEEQLDYFRQEVDGSGLSSYPHPWLMDNFWQFPTVSMGLGPIMAIYQARFMRYMENRGLIEKSNRKVWMYLGDGETDEPESLGAISVASREDLDNLIFVVNCNLQRLDGPVRGNGKIIQELEGEFRGAGWNVIKVVWGSPWDDLLAKDKTGLLKKRMAEVLDGDYQTYKSRDGGYVRDNFFGKYPELLELVSHLSDEDIFLLTRGGHDSKKVYNAYHQAVNHQGSPTVILAKTVKGYGMMGAGQGENTAHQQKKLNDDEVRRFRDRFKIPISDEDIHKVPYYKPPEDSDEIQYLHKQRESLGGYLPRREEVLSEKLPLPALKAFQPLLDSSEDREFSTTMAYVRLMSILLRDKHIKDRVVPIVPDEARTFGMEGLFRQIGIYSPHGQQYTPADSDQMMWYKETSNGQVLEEGINEAGAMSSWIAAGTSYANHGKIMIPFYIYYSMFGYQRVGDLVWAAGDMQARGFLLGATAGRTTLAGEGLQHQDGHQHLMFRNVPNCYSYDPTFAYELVVIVQDGLKRMYQEDEKCFYYISLMNENYPHPAMPKGCEEGIVKGLYLFQAAPKGKADVQLLGCGTILLQVLEAAKILQEEWGVSADVWSVPSFNLLSADGDDCTRWNMLNSTKKPRIPYVTKQLKKDVHTVAATDYVRAYADQIRAYVPSSFSILGTDGYGRSDTRQKLRHFFEVDCHWIVLQTLYDLAQQEKIDKTSPQKAMKKYGLSADKPNPLSC